MAVLTRIGSTRALFPFAEKVTFANGPMRTKRPELVSRRRFDDAPRRPATVPATWIHGPLGAMSSVLTSRRSEGFGLTAHRETRSKPVPAGIRTAQSVS